MNCIIIDDEAISRLIINQMITDFSEIKILGEFSNAIQAIKFLNHNEVDFIFLDIHMPEFTGFDFIETIKNPPKIILITSDRNLAIEAFEYHCVIDYIVKPITKERFGSAIQKLNNLKNLKPIENENNINTESKNEFFVNIDKRLIKIEYAAVNIIEAKGDYVLIKTENKNYLVHSTLKKIEEKLPKEFFLKVHRSFIINLKKIIDIESNSVLINKEIIPISRSNKEELMTKLNLL